MPVDFDPNAVPERTKSQLWATYRADRRTGPKFKIHNGKAQAKQALDWCSHVPVALYVRPTVDSEWTKVGELSMDRTPDRRVNFARDKAALVEKMDALA